MKGTSAPQTGDLKTGINVGRAQVADLSDLNQRVGKVADDALARKNKEKDDKKKKEDEIQSALGTEGVLVRDQIDLQNQVDAFTNAIDYDRLETDKKYKMQVMNGFNKLKANIYSSAESRKRYNAQWLAKNKEPNKYTDPVLEDTHKFPETDPRRYYARTDIDENYVPDTSYEDESKEFNVNLTTLGAYSSDKDGMQKKGTFKEVRAQDIANYKARTKDDSKKRKFYNYEWKQKYGIEASRMTPEQLKEKGIPTLDQFIDEKIDGYALGRQNITSSTIQDNNLTGGKSLDKDNASTRYKNVERVVAGFDRENSEIRNTKDEKERFFNNFETKVEDGKTLYRAVYTTQASTEEKDAKGLTKRKAKEKGWDVSEWMTKDGAETLANNLYSLKEKTQKWDFQEVTEKNTYEYEDIYKGGSATRTKTNNPYIKTQTVNGEEVPYIDAEMMSNEINSYKSSAEKKAKAEELFTPMVNNTDDVILKDIEKEVWSSDRDNVEFEVKGVEVTFDITDADDRKKLTAFMKKYPNAFPPESYASYEQEMYERPDQLNIDVTTSTQLTNVPQGTYLDKNGNKFKVLSTGLALPVEN